ncbi:MAG: tetraacyldisaccharide 4'-kinase [Chlorobi bacterium]|nr:tetraacyldisaccharide 4'-kinase [Chlorobiota bacterium]
MLGPILWLRHKLYDIGFLSSWTPPIPLIGIGNLELGGTGKTPFTIYLANLLKNKHSVGVVNHGYRLKSSDPIIASPETVHLLNEEAILIWERTGVPLVAGRNRRKAIELLLSKHPDIDLLIADDILQHRKINPHIPILITRFDKPYYKNRLIPFGTLRDIKSRAKAFPVLVYTYSPLIDEKEKAKVRNFTSWHDLVLFAHASYGPPYPVTENLGKPDGRFLAVCGIANPSAFLSFTKNKFQVVGSLCFRDHKEYALTDIKNIIALCKKNNVDSIITTEKDAVKLKRFKEEFESSGVSVLAIPLTLQLNPEDEQQLLTYLSEKLEAYGQERSQDMDGTHQ